MHLLVVAASCPGDSGRHTTWPAGNLVLQHGVDRQVVDVGQLDYQLDHFQTLGLGFLHVPWVRVDVLVWDRHVHVLVHVHHHHQPDCGQASLGPDCGQAFLDCLHLPDGGQGVTLASLDLGGWAADCPQMDLVHQVLQLLLSS